MNTLAATAERLRLVKAAEKRFLALWATECIFSQAKPLEACAEDAYVGPPQPPAGRIGAYLNLFPEPDLDDLEN
jgi:hypothetical protein